MTSTATISAMGLATPVVSEPGFVGIGCLEGTKTKYHDVCSLATARRLSGRLRAGNGPCPCNGPLQVARLKVCKVAGGAMVRALEHRNVNSAAR